MLTKMGVGGRFRCSSLYEYSTPLHKLFETRKTLSLEKPNAKLLKTCSKDNSNKYFLAIKYQEFQFDQTTVRN